MEPIEVTQKIMGGRFYIKAFSQPHYSKQETTQILEEALQLAQTIEDELTDFRPSPFQQININAGVKPVEVSPRILELFKLAQHYTTISEGLFDISSGPLIHLWRQERSGKKISEQQWTEAIEAVGIEKIIVDQQKSTIFLPLTQMKLSFGGIGKGYAVDQLYQYLREKNIENFYVNGSGDIRVHSHPNAPRPWRVGIQNPFSIKYKDAGVIQLKNEACATSGTYKNSSQYSSKRSNHILNPFTGESPTDIVSCTIIAQTSIETDVHATIVMLLPKEKREQYLEQHQLKAITINQQGKVSISPNLLQAMQ